MCLFRPFACWAVGEMEKEGCHFSNTIDCYWHVDSSLNKKVFQAILVKCVIYLWSIKVQQKSILTAPNFLHWVGNILEDLSKIQKY